MKQRNSEDKLVSFARRVVDRIALTTTLIVGLSLVAACGSSPEAATNANDAIAIQGGEQGALPSGHPPIQSAPADAVPPVPIGSGTGALALNWTVPEAWITEIPSSTMRRAQYRIPGEAGDAECIVFYFGPGQGGDADANAERWATQFSQPDGRSSVDVMQKEQIDVDGITTLLVEVTGTYGGGMNMGNRPLPELADHMLIGAIAKGPDANWFFKLTGPESTVAPQREAFHKMARSLRAGM